MTVIIIVSNFCIVSCMISCLLLNNEVLENKQIRNMRLWFEKQLLPSSTVQIKPKKENDVGERERKIEYAIKDQKVFEMNDQNWEMNHYDKQWN